MRYLRTLTIVSITALAGLPMACAASSVNTEPERHVQVQNDPLKSVAKQLDKRDADKFLQVVGSYTDTNTFIEALSNLKWHAEPPKDLRGVQTAIHNDIRIQITGAHSGFLKTLGEKYESAKIDAETYQVGMRVVAALLDGMLRSHSDIDDPNVDTLNSILTYAALTRAAISIELRKHGFVGDGVLTDEQHELLKIAARDMKYELFDDLP